MGIQIQSKDNRRSARSKMMLAATLNSEGGHVTVRLLDLSSHGALIVGDGIPTVHTDVAVRCGTQSVMGSIAWVHGNKAGVKFHEPVGRHQFTRRIGFTSHDVVTYTRNASYRRPGFRGNQLTAEERYFLDQLLSDHAIATVA